MKDYMSLHDAWDATLRSLGVYGPEWKDRDAPPRAAVKLYNKDGSCSLQKAEEFLMELLSTGSLEAVGNNASGVPENKTEVWEYGDVLWDKNAIRFGSKIILEDILVKKSDLERELSERKIPKDTNLKRRECDQWLREEMKTSPEFRPKPFKEFYKDAKVLFGISERAFRQVWDKANIETGAVWNKGGRPKKPRT